MELHVKYWDGRILSLDAESHGLSRLLPTTFPSLRSLTFATQCYRSISDDLAADLLSFQRLRKVVVDVSPERHHYLGHAESISASNAERHAVPRTGR